MQNIHPHDDPAAGAMRNMLAILDLIWSDHKMGVGVKKLHRVFIINHTTIERAPDKWLKLKRGGHEQKLFISRDGRIAVQTYSLKLRNRKNMSFMTKKWPVVLPVNEDAVSLPLVEQLIEQLTELRTNSHLSDAQGHYPAVYI